MIIFLRLLDGDLNLPTEQEKLDFAHRIETIVIEKELTYMDAILHFCEEYEIEETVAASLISVPLRIKLESQVRSLHLVKKDNTLKLPT